MGPTTWSAPASGPEGTSEMRTPISGGPTLPGWMSPGEDVAAWDASSLIPHVVLTGAPR